MMDTTKIEEKTLKHMWHKMLVTYFMRILVCSCLLLLILIVWKINELDVNVTPHYYPSGMESLQMERKQHLAGVCLNNTQWKRYQFYHHITYEDKNPKKV